MTIKQAVEQVTAAAPPGATVVFSPSLWFADGSELPQLREFRVHVMHGGGTLAISSRCSGLHLVVADVLEQLSGVAEPLTLDSLNEQVAEVMDLQCAMPRG